MSRRLLTPLLIALATAGLACSTLSVGHTPAHVQAEPVKDYLSLEWARYAWQHARGVNTDRVQRIESQLYASLDPNTSTPTPRSPQLLAEELIDLQANAEHYYLYGRVLQSQSHLDLAESAYTISLELDPLDRGLILARLASVHSQKQDAQTAYRFLQSSIDNGFNGFSWLNSSPELAYLHKQDDFRDRYLAMLPNTMTHEQLNLGGSFEAMYDRGGTTYIFCENGKFREEFAGEGVWFYKDGQLQLQFTQWCDSEWDDDSEDYVVSCKPVDGEEEPFTLMDAGELQQTLGHNDDSEFYFNARNGEEPEFCNAP